LRVFFQAYAPVIALAAALFNGAAALMLAQFFKDRVAAKLVLATLVFLMSVAAVGTVAYNQRQIIARMADANVHSTEIRTAIGGLITEGNSLMVKCADSKTPPPTDAAANWRSRAEAFLVARLGESFAARFRDPTGVPAAMLSDSALDAAHQELWYGLYFRVYRLEEIVLDMT
jgi:hypothetical protein